MRALGRYFTFRSTSQALAFRRILGTYDIACQFEIHFLERLIKNFGDLCPGLSTAVQKYLIWRIPKMHEKDHKSCFEPRYSLNYTKGAGRSHHEGIEQSWAESKQSGGSTRQMNHGHRHDTLNDFHNFWNWRKMEGMGTYLVLFKYYCKLLIYARYISQIETS